MALHHFLIGIVLVVLQLAAAVPWLVVALLPPGREVAWRRQLVAAENLVRNLVFAGIVLLGGLILGVMLWQLQDGPALERAGRVYGALLHFQLIVDFFVLSLAALLLVWPKGAAVALAAFREGFRQPMFWLLLLFALVLMSLFPLIPYFTLGDDQVMVKEMGYETIMLFTLIFGVMTASMSIADEIEGRTAITLMSKPVSRREFLLGKFVGIFFSGLVLVGLLGWFFNSMVLFKQWLAPLEGNIETVPPPLPFVNDWLGVLADNHLVPPDASLYFLRGGFLWLADTLQNLPGLVLGSCQIMVLLALAVALATRATMIINLVTCLAVYVMGHLSPVLLEIARQRLREAPNANGPRLLSFVASLLSAVLPGSEYFNISPALATDSPPPLLDFYPYVGEVVLYALLYTSIVLIVGLFAFEDRDLA